jgi:hypothetical protein
MAQLFAAIEMEITEQKLRHLAIRNTDFLMRILIISLCSGRQKDAKNGRHCHEEARRGTRT